MAIGEVFLGAALQVIFEKVLSAMAPEVLKFMKRVKGIQPRTVKELEHQLRRIEAVLIDAEQKQIHSRAVKLWLQNLRDLFYDVEDLLDELAAEAQLHQMMKLDPQFWIYQQSQLSGEFRSTKFKLAHRIMANCGSKVNSLTGNIKHRLDFSSRVKVISESLQNILGQIEVLNLAQNLVQHQRLSSSAGTTINPSWRQSTSIVCEPIVYGRDNEKREIISWLLKDEPSYGNFFVYSIVGKGGIGKTTLAQSIYNDEQLKDGHFELKGWVCVSDVFDTKRITTTILNSVTKGSYEFSDLNQAQERLREVIRRKRFLIVLDDVWSDEYADWDSLQIPFREGTRGSRVIATTRGQNVARTMNPRPNNMILVHGLSNEDCWNLFRRHAFEDAEMEISPNFADMKDDILRKCKGLPLAAKALGGLLRAKSEESEWQQIINSNIWSTEDSQVLQVLRLSYHYLPSHLKSCFAYCAIFPKDFEFTEEMLILLWMAQGLLPEKATQQMEDIGHDNFSNLVSRSFFEPGSHSYQHFKMHDLISDLAQWAAGDVNMELDYQSRTKDGNKDCSKIRHISFQGALAIRKDNSFPILKKTKHLRTLFCSGEANGSITAPLLILKNIRVLYLARMYCLELPNSIGVLKLLRYLDLSFNYELKIPESICSLCNLQTLVLRGCRNLQKLPQNMKYLVKLRHLDINNTPSLQEMPLGFGNLTNLQRLNKFVVGQGHGHTIRELRSLNCLHKSFTITGLENVVSEKDAQDARLYEKLNLDELQLESESFAIEVDDKVQTRVFEQLRPPKCIRKCIFRRYRAVTLPNWLGLEDPYFTHMIVIKLESCHGCKSLPSFGKLPSLKELYLKDMDGIKCIGPEFYGSSSRSSFPALKILSFNDMRAWEEWLHPNSDIGEFPCLEELWIEDCPSLQGSFPSNLPRLRGLIIHACNQFSVSLPILPMLRILSVTRCKRLSSTSVVCSSKLIALYSVSEFHGLKGLWVEGLHRLWIDDDHALLQLTEMSWHEEPIMHIAGCGYLHSLWPSGFGELDNLAEVSMGNCPELAPFLLPSTIKRMRFVNMESGEYITWLTGVSAGCLETLAIMYNKSPIYFELPIHLHGFHSLGELTIKRCSLIRGFPGGGLPRNLKLLTIINVGIERPIHEWGLHHLCCLEQLTIVGCNSFHWSESFPGDGLLPSSLTRLIISEHLNLRFMSLSTVPNLVHLVLDDCPKLESFVDNWLPPGIQFLRIHGCPLLKEQCERDPLRQTLLHISHFTFLLQIGNTRRQKWLCDLMPASAKR